MEIGDRYYYTGDQANIEDFGTITNIISDKWGMRFEGRLDDGRIQRGVHIIVFDKGPGQRFKSMEQYNQEREAALEKFKQYANNLNRLEG